MYLERSKITRLIFNLLHPLPTFTFTRSERLKSKKLLGGLFKGGNSYVAYPLRVVWSPLPDGHEPAGIRAQVAISVPKRIFKTAVARNLLKRRIREAYRLHKHTLYEQLAAEDRRIVLMLLYVAREALPFTEIEAGVAKMIRKFPGK